MVYAIAAIFSIVALFVFAKVAKGKTPEKTRPNPSRFDGLIEQYAYENGLRFELLKAVIRKESNFNPRAVNDERKKGDPSDDAIGLMQVRQPALTDYNETHGSLHSIDDLYEPQVNIQVGAWYLSRFVKRYGETVGVEMFNVGETGYKTKNVRNAAYVSSIIGYAKNYA